MMIEPRTHHTGLGNEVTIIVPTRNEARNIGTFLGSVPAHVTVVVVDRSADGTLDVARRSRPAKLVTLECGESLTAARQLGAANASTPWLLFTDADVTFDAGYFNRLAELLAQSAPPPRISMWYGPKLSADAYRGHYLRLAAAQKLVGAAGIPAASGSNMLVSREAFAAVGGFDVRLTCNEDSELGWRVARAGFGWRYDPRLVVWARDHRRLHRGRLRKTLHTVGRCTTLYLGLIPERWRSHDWGYWKPAERRTD